MFGAGLLRVEKDADASRVYLWPFEHTDGFVRERLALQEGLAESRRVVQVGTASLHPEA